MSQIPATYSNSYSAGSSYSAGIWQGTNAVFPSIPGGNLPGDRAPMPSTPSSGATSSGTGLLPGKKPGFKLRRSILPKQPLTILHELSGGTKPTFDYYDVPYEERERRAWQMDCDLEDIGCYECRCNVRGMEFIAEGDTKLDAKNSVIEVAIQGLINALSEKNEAEGCGTNEDHTPWPQIASLALYKLYNDWQSQGYTLPQELSSVPSAGGVGGGVRSHNANDTPLGEGAAASVNKPALQQLNELASKMKMTLQYDCVSELGPPNNKVFSYAVKIGTKTFTGQAQNKKAAKQAAAAAALADKDSWYCPPVHQPPAPGDDEASTEDTDNSGYDPMSMLPPSRKKAAMDSEMKKLYFGNDKAEQAPGTSEPKIKFREPQDKGAQPGSHPSNR